MRLDDRTAVVTGGGNGIGRACCERFAEEGANVVVADILDEAAEQTVNAVKERGREAVFVHLDASSPDDNDAMADTAVERFGSIDVVVTAAGISHADYVSGDHARDIQTWAEQATSMMEPGAALRNLDVQAWQKVLDVNLTGTMLAVRACALKMLDAGKPGSIITIASIAAKRPEAGPLSYAVSKAGVWMFTKSVARQLGAAGIRVNAIGPGFIETNMTAILTNVDEIKTRVLEQIPLGRVGEPRDIANCALFLASDESSYFTGEILHPDGGFFTD